MSACAVLRWVVVGSSAVCYVIALALPAYYDSAPGIDYYRTLSGLECLLSPVSMHPVVLLICPFWWANPIYGLGLLALSRGWNGVAAGTGIVATLTALLFLAQVNLIYHMRAANGIHDVPVLPAFWFWLSSMVLLVLGSLAVTILDRPRAPGKFAEIDARKRLDKVLS